MLVRLWLRAYKRKSVTNTYLLGHFLDVGIGFTIQVMRLSNLLGVYLCLFVSDLVPSKLMLMLQCDFLMFLVERYNCGLTWDSKFKLI